jgi:predicted dehydrogenase
MTNYLAAYIVAVMIEAAEVRPGNRVLEVGAGSGYAAAVIAQIAERVYAIERHEALAASAAQRITALGYDNVDMIIGDGSRVLADQFPGARILHGYDALLADPDIDAIYIATPHPTHAEWAMKAARAGKHVLCEKPIGLSAAEAEAMQTTAREAGIFLGEAYMYRLHPLTQKLIELLKAKSIGEVRMIKSSFGFNKPFDKDHRLFANDLAGGGILDVGGYPVSMARLIAGIDVPDGILEPDHVLGAGHLGSTGVDEWSAAILRFPNGVIAEVACSVSLAQDNVLRIFGTGGRIEVDQFWFAAGKQGGTAVIRLFDASGTRTDVTVDERRHVYSFEADAAAEAIHAGRREFAYPGMSAADTLGNLKVMDKWRAGVGLEYTLETPAVRTKTLLGETLCRKGTRVPRGRIPGVEKETSLLALGMMLFSTFPAAAIALDEFYEAGGNLIDSGFQYGGGTQDRLIGEWVRSAASERMS